MMIDLLKRQSVSGNKFQGGIIINSSPLFNDVSLIL